MPAIVVDPGLGSWYESENSEGQWLSFDFHEMRVAITHYAVTCYHLMTWELEGSLDGENWNLIDRVEGYKKFGKRGTETFQAANLVESRIVRLTPIGRNLAYNWEMTICGIEFFGTLWE
jgi:hypothetical protein